MEALVVLGAIALIWLVCKFNSSTIDIHDSDGRYRGYKRHSWNPDPNYSSWEDHTH